jgi:hypothetical protein
LKQIETRYFLISKIINKIILKIALKYKWFLIRMLTLSDYYEIIMEEKGWLGGAEVAEEEKR